jgi:hypothetical protein
VEWIQLAQDRGQWQAVVNAVLNLRVSGATNLVTWLVYRLNDVLRCIHSLLLLLVVVVLSLLVK